MLYLLKLRNLVALGTIVGSAYSGYKLYQELKKLDEEKSLRTRLDDFLKEAGEFCEKKSEELYSWYVNTFSEELSESKAQSEKFKEKKADVAKKAEKKKAVKKAPQKTVKKAEVKEEVKTSSKVTKKPAKKAKKVEEVKPAE